MYILDRLEPQSLGALIALYEHRTRSRRAGRDQPLEPMGRELGKEWASSILSKWDGEVADPVTASLLRRLKS